MFVFLWNVSLFRGTFVSTSSMLTKEQISLIRIRMDEEHRLDREALERLMKFLPASIVSAGNIEQSNEPPFDRDQSMSVAVEHVMSYKPNRTWTGKQILAEFGRLDYPVKAKTPMSTIAIALKKLLTEGKIKAVRKGAGREPHIYQWKLQNVKIEDCEPRDEEESLEEERPHNEPPF